MASTQFRIAIADTKETDSYYFHIETDLCKTFNEAINAVCKQLEYLQDKKMYNRYVGLTIYKYRWEDLPKFGKKYNETLEEIRYYPKDYNREA